tara:strand:+ start:1499 stop:1633 length:135 start_codon:yes stop_codon:yes gene_type:complete
MNGRERAAHELWNYYNMELHIVTTIDVVLELIDAGVELTREMNI